MTASFHHASPSFGQQPSSMASLYQRRGGAENTHSIELLPNPDFVFPAQSAAEGSPSLDNWHALNRRPQSSQQAMLSTAPSAGARGHQPRGSAALPDFTFNPSATRQNMPRAVVTPPQSPTSLVLPSTPSGGRGHRRGGSEFIGGDGKGGAGLLSTSPTKGDSVLPTPSLPGRLGPPAGGRGHRHRRSGAISCHDLQSIMQPSVSGTRGGSAPATPLEVEPRPFFGSPNARRSASQADISSRSEQIRSASDSSPPRVIPRVRVGFADRVEYIRPLSTISSETESSLSTIRGGHSVSGSLSSVISLSTASPPSARMARPPSLHTTFEDETMRARPQTSGDVSEAIEREKDASRLQWTFPVRPKTSANPSSTSELAPRSIIDVPKAPKRRSFGWWEAKKPQHTLRSSISEPSLVPSTPTSPESTDVSTFSVMSEDVPSPEIEKPAKSKKSKSWTRSLISRKSRSHGNLKAKPLDERVPTPPLVPKSALETYSPAAEKFNFGFDEPPEFEPEFEPNFDIDETVTIVSEEPKPSLNLAPLKQRLHADSDPMSPVIDLDAALGPFNTPSFGANTRGTSPKTQPRPKRSLHSLGYQAALNHRRTESAPELVPFDQRNTKIAPSATMPDVFEEEDEEMMLEGFQSEAGAECTDSSVNEVSALGIITKPENAFEETTPRKPSGISMSPHLRPALKDRRTSCNSLSPSSASQRASSVVDVVEDYEEPRASSFTRDSDSTITPPMTAEDEKAPRPLINLQLPVPNQSVMTPDTLTGSSFSSRHFSNSQISLSTPRLGSATSSTADSRSMTFGEHVPPVRISHDDVPSLSSSRSTMTTPPQHPFAFAETYRRDGRATSIASAPSFEEQRRRSKRASIVSLSRLVGVKSKLSIETRPQSQHIMSTTAPQAKTKKANRLSKLMQFWRKQPGDSRRGAMA